jgi:hypothetical protein
MTVARSWLLQAALGEVLRMPRTSAGDAVPRHLGRQRHHDWLVISSPAHGWGARELIVALVRGNEVVYHEALQVHTFDTAGGTAARLCPWYTSSDVDPLACESCWMLTMLRLN